VAVCMLIVTQGGDVVLVTDIHNINCTKSEKYKNYTHDNFVYSIHVRMMAWHHTLTPYIRNCVTLLNKVGLKQCSGTRCSGLAAVVFTVRELLNVMVNC
jgi:hypothetical protein